MHDREFRKPTPVILVDPDGKARGTYLFDAYVAEFVWSYPKWDGDESWGEAQVRLGAAIRAAKAGGRVRIERAEDAEKLREANAAAQLRGPYADQIRPMSLAIRRMGPATVDPETNGLVVSIGRVVRDTDLAPGLGDGDGDETS